MGLFVFGEFSKRLGLKTKNFPVSGGTLVSELTGVKAQRALKRSGFLPSALLSRPWSLGA